MFTDCRENVSVLWVVRGVVISCRQLNVCRKGETLLGVVQKSRIREDAGVTGKDVV